MKIKSPLVARVVALSGLFLGAFALAVAAGTWTSPTQTPPDGNVSAPVNVGGGGTGTDRYPQIKTGILTLNNLVAVNMNVASGTINTAGSVLTNDGNGNASWASGGGSGSIPSGAIMAFDLGSCPSGWSIYTKAQGRFVLGFLPGVGLAYPDYGYVGSTGGQETYTLSSVNQLPRFQVSFTLPIGDRVQSNLASNNDGHEIADRANTTYTSTVGAASPDPYQIMPPYVTELYCKKN